MDYPCTEAQQTNIQHKNTTQETTLWIQSSTKQVTYMDDVFNYFSPIPEYSGDFGDYSSLLKKSDGTLITTSEEWERKRQDIRQYWMRVMGEWPQLIDHPEWKILSSETTESFTRNKIQVEYAPGLFMEAYLLVPQGKGPFPAVLDLYYRPEPGAGLDESRRNEIDFGYQLAQRGIVALCIGTPQDIRENILYPDREHPTLQPLNFMAYISANMNTLLRQMPQVKSNRIGVVGHSMGGKWAMFSACLNDKFATGVWSDPGIVWDESHPDTNYWESWYLGWEPGRNEEANKRITPEIKRFSAYKKLWEENHDLHELLALMAPRPFLVSGGSCDKPRQWRPLNRVGEVYQVMGYSHRIGMTNRENHKITPEDNARIIRFLEKTLKEDF